MLMHNGDANGDANDDANVDADGVANGDVNGDANGNANQVMPMVMPIWTLQQWINYLIICTPSMTDFTSMVAPMDDVQKLLMPIVAVCRFSHAECTNGDSEKHN